MKTWSLTKITHRPCAYGQDASQRSNHLVAFGVFCSVGILLAVESRELFDAKTLERLATAGVISHCDGECGGLGWR